MHQKRRWKVSKTDEDFNYQQLGTSPETIKNCYQPLIDRFMVTNYYQPLIDTSRLPINIYQLHSG